MACSVSADAILQALTITRPATMRQEVHETAGGVTVIDDTYNANPDSMKAALALLARLPATRKHIAVLGDMYELGAEEREFHFEVGELAHIFHLTMLVCVGELGSCIAKGALAAGMDPNSVIVCANAKEAVQAVTPYLTERPIILVKASRGMHLEQVVEEVLGLC
jgi:UDP-N-acetylmuramoyl-tripeptide--D-alanyl-D-alanine ligase